MVIFSENTRHVIEAGAPFVAIGTIAGWFAGLLPTIAAFLSIVWLLMQMAMSWDRFECKLRQLFKKGNKTPK